MLGVHSEKHGVETSSLWQCSSPTPPKPSHGMVRCPPEKGRAIIQEYRNPWISLIFTKKRKQLQVLSKTHIELDNKINSILYLSVKDTPRVMCFSFKCHYLFLADSLHTSLTLHSLMWTPRTLIFIPHISLVWILISGDVIALKQEQMKLKDRKCVTSESSKHFVTDVPLINLSWSSMVACSVLPAL